jgi:hypothetical protein
MAANVWFSQLFENSYDGGVLVALPYEALADWPGAGDDYDEVVDEVGQFLCRPVGKSVGLFVSEDEGVHEAHWMRFDDESGVILVVWIAWDDPSRPTLPEDMKQVALAWQRGDDPRQTWIAERLRRDDLIWQQQELVQSIPGGVLLLLHAEDCPMKARFAKPRSVAKCGELVSFGISPGDYRLICELPNGAHMCLVCRWTAVNR